VRIRVLLVDDEQAILDGLAEVLRCAGYEVTSTLCGREALDKIGQFCPDVLLTDVLLPGTNGFELALQVKERCPKCRLLLFSGQAATAMLAQSFAPKFTALGYRFELLPKPLHPTALLARLEQILTHMA
jgi:CheY-like chemotaxis protein